ncbi:MAG: glucose 1-dehydrogenase [Chloroflexi bacterium]|nr:glucose 1-dehydrogenase [Chloroflexota bacterium]
MRLKDRVAVVTGAASGIGKATAVLFGQEGAKVMCADVNGEGAARVAEQIMDAGGEGASLQVDVAREADVQGMVAETVQRWGGLDVQFNNAGVGYGMPVTSVSEEDWDRLLSINLKGVFLGCKHAIPEMLKGGGGAIVNTASDAGLMGMPWLSTYCASKGGVVLLTKALAVEWAQQGIRVNCVCPGVIRTPILDPFVAQAQQVSGDTPEAVWQRLAQTHPMNRVGEADEVARAVLFLVSDEASFITGVALPIDGGLTAGAPLAQPRRQPTE